MISAKNINFDAPTKIDPPSSTQENSNVEIKNNNTDNKDDKSAKDNVDPNGFVSLLGHVISNAQQQNATD